MAKNVKNTSHSSTDMSDLVPAKAEKNLPKLVDKFLFAPTNNMIKIKSKFWSKYNPGPFSSPDNLTMAQALKVTDSPSLERWWSEPGFVEWFTNREEEREKIKYLLNKALDSLESVLDDPTTNPNAKVNATKVLLETAGYLTKKPVEKFADDQINKMSEQQLMAFLEQKGVKITQEKVVEVDGKDKKDNS